jgi:GR25 family glycosyltransferase involved in LPS biosynthesis
LTTLNSERYDYIKKQVSSIKNIDFEFIITDKVDLIELSTKNFIKLFPQKYKYQYNRLPKIYDFTKNRYLIGTLGCLYSHYLAYKKIYDNGLDKAIILEDNVTLSSQFEDKIKYMIDNIDDNWDIIHLFSCKPEEEAKLRVEYKNNIYYGDHEYYTAKGQIVSNKFVNVMINLIPFFEVADGITMIPSLKYYGTNLKSYVCYPYIIDINRYFKTSTRTSTDLSYCYSIDFQKISNNKYIYLAKCNNIYSYNNLSVYFQINCGFCKKKSHNTYDLLYKIISKEYLKNILKEYTVPTPQDIIKNTENVLLINSCELNINSDYTYDIGNDEFIIFYLSEFVFTTIKLDAINNEYNTTLHYLENYSDSIDI